VSPAPTLSASVGTQPVCASGSTAATTFTINYLTTNATTLDIKGGGSESNTAAAASGTTAPIAYTCGSGAAYTVTASGAGGKSAPVVVTPAPVAPTTPTPTPSG
jgi:hypothetical protein